MCVGSWRTSKTSGIFNHMIVHLFLLLKASVFLNNGGYEENRIKENKDYKTINGCQHLGKHRNSKSSDELEANESLKHFSLLLINWSVYFTTTTTTTTTNTTSRSIVYSKIQHCEKQANIQESSVPTEIGIPLSDTAKWWWSLYLFFIRLTSYSYSCLHSKDEKKH
uniref:Uncharacterized protein n=1 Tax=Glossina pallidipes TaxID=7398 RepID=A0A1B0AF60_GLOPL